MGDHRAKVESRIRQLESGNVTRISGTARQSAKFDKHQPKSEVIEYKAAADFTKPTKRALDEDEEEKPKPKKIKVEVEQEVEKKKKKKKDKDSPEEAMDIEVKQDQDSEKRKRRKRKRRKLTKTWQWLTALWIVQLTLLWKNQARRKRKKRRKRKQRMSNATSALVWC